MYPFIPSYAQFITEAYDRQIKSNMFDMKFRNSSKALRWGNQIVHMTSFILIIYLFEIKEDF